MVLLRPLADRLQRRPVDVPSSVSAGIQAFSRWVSGDSRSRNRLATFMPLS